MQTDVVILGAGAAGMTVALAVQARGLQAVLIDPMAQSPNNFAISGGLFPAAGSQLQHASGIDEQPEGWLADVRAFAPDCVNENIASSVAHALPEVVDFFIHRCDAPIHFLPDVVAPGHRTLRFHSIQPASGARFHAWFREQINQKPNLQFFQCISRVQRLAHGFSIHLQPTAGATEVQFETRNLVLAGGGFGANADMVTTWIPAMAGALNNGSSTQDGSTLQMGLQWGAQVWGMDGFQGQGHTHPGGATRLGMSIPSLGGVMVDRQGLRFVPEDLGPSSLAPHVIGQPDGLALEIFDAFIEAQLKNHSAYQQALHADRVMSADTVQSLAQVAGVNERGLEETFRQVSLYATGQAKDPLGRQAFPRVLEPPFKASWVTGALSHTQGGLLTDARGAVLGQDGQAIAGLFAAGGSAAGLAGRGADGYLPGNGLAQAFGLGWRVAQALD